LKEAVSNAVRHGEATEAEISIDRVDDDVLQIEAVNNGKPGSRSSNRKGIGSELLDEVCLSWELTQNRKKVRLFAELAIKL
jgi:two-component sensor histidine kinase